MRTAGLICLAVAASACTTVGDATSSSIPTTAVVVTTTSITETTSGSDSSQPASTSQVPSSIEVGDEVLGGGTLGATIEAILPQDFNAQTEGLAWDGVGLVESTGPYGSSQRRLLSTTSGRTSRAVDLAPELFATDLVIGPTSGIQLSAREGIATVFALDDLDSVGRFRFDGEGWGICASAESLVTSDNSAVLTLRDAETFEVTDTRQVAEPFGELRALECAKGLVWAVLGDSNTIAAVDLGSGDVKGVLDLNQLVPTTAGPNDQLTAIAYNPTSNTFFVAGRRWGVLYELTVVTPG